LNFCMISCTCCPSFKQQKQQPILLRCDENLLKKKLYGILFLTFQSITTAFHRHVVYVRVTYTTYVLRTFYLISLEWVKFIQTKS
jgi:hypothetical protein